MLSQISAYTINLNPYMVRRQSLAAGACLLLQSYSKGPFDYDVHFPSSSLRVSLILTIVSFCMQMLS